MSQNHFPNIRRRIRQRRRTLTPRPPILTREIPIRSTPFRSTPPTTTTSRRLHASQPRTLRRHAHTGDITAQGPRAVVVSVPLIYNGR